MEYEICIVSCLRNQRHGFHDEIAIFESKAGRWRTVTSTIPADVPAHLIGFIYDDSIFVIKPLVLHLYGSHGTGGSNPILVYSFDRVTELVSDLGV